RIVANSPGLHSSESITKSELLQRKAENNLPDPELNGEYQWGQAGVGDKWSIGISQSFEWPGVYQARNKANAQAAVAADARIRSEYMDKMLDVKLLLIEYVAIRQRIQILEKIKEHVSDLNTFYKNAYDHGETTVIDLNKSTIELAEIKSRYNAALNDLSAATEAIQKEAGITPVDTWLVNIDQFPAETMLTEDQYTALINTADQSIRYADASYKAAQYDAKAAKRSSVAPGFSLGYTHIYELGDNFNGVSVGLSLPVFSAKGKYKAATYQVSALHREYESAIADRISEMKSCRSQAVRMSEELAEISPVVLDKRPAELLLKALKGGEISLLTYLQELNFFLEAQLDYTDTLRDYHILMARLNRYAAMLPN
ncbi:MAG: TolC family protein, partial [Muribaculaceae bacterium]|nr:TolC family protein [Muribaculaceae bacterium]